jgi:rfaE bifunctional protein kinase chain/domain
VISPAFALHASSLARARVLIAGDVMLDRYWFGEVNRISPEAPVPIVHVQRSEERPGGAANVARNAATLGARTSLLALVGADEPGRSLTALLHRDGVETRMHQDPDLPTTVKLRVLGRQQQLLRIDFETQPSREALQNKLKDFEAMVANTDIVVLSDYGKGALDQVEKMIAICRAAGKRVLVDPKGDDYRRYRGATMVTPNRSEFREVAGRWRTEDELTEKAEKLRRELELEALLVTRSEEGMTLYRENHVMHEPTLAREVYDVSGAGDTVIATLAVMLAAGLPMPEAVNIANRAAGIVVGKLGTATVTLEELQLGPETL